MPEIPSLKTQFKTALRHLPDIVRAFEAKLIDWSDFDLGNDEFQGAAAALFEKGVVIPPAVWPKLSAKTVAIMAQIEAKKAAVGPATPHFIDMLKCNLSGVVGAIGFDVPEAGLDASVYNYLEKVAVTASPSTWSDAISRLGIPSAVTRKIAGQRAAITRAKNRAAGVPSKVKKAYLDFNAACDNNDVRWLGKNVEKILTEQPNRVHDMWERLKEKNLLSVLSYFPEASLAAIRDEAIAVCAEKSPGQAALFKRDMTEALFATLSDKARLREYANVANDGHNEFLFPKRYSYASMKADLGFMLLSADLADKARGCLAFFAFIEEIAAFRNLDLSEPMKAPEDSLRFEHLAKMNDERHYFYTPVEKWTRNDFRPSQELILWAMRRPKAEQRWCLNYITKNTTYFKEAIVGFCPSLLGGKPVVSEFPTPD